MSAVSWFGVVFVLGGATYAMRAGPILVLADRELPAAAVRLLRNVGAAVLSALVVTLIADPGAANRGITVAEVAGLVVAIPVAYRTRNLLITLAAGMAAFWLALWLS